MKQKIQANISGFMGKPVSLFGVIDTDSNVLNIVTLSSKQVPRKADCFLISNNAKLEHDYLFDEKNILPSVDSYYRIKGGVAEDGQTPLLMIGNRVGAADPVSAIESNGVGASGMEYRIAPDISNQQMAVLAMCLYADQSTSIQNCFEMFNELNGIEEIMQGGYFQI